MKCETCKFWLSEPNIGGGTCNRYAPRPSENAKPTKWPRTAATDFCGEYYEK